MQITINQSEIESAITTYIGGLFKLNPGTKVQIELKATRGAEGATAIIDIVPDSQTGQMTAAAVQEPKKKEAEVINEIKATSAKLFTAPPVVEAPAAITVDEAIASIPEVAAEAPVLVPEAEVPVPTRTSLFAGLKKPVNA
jgi:hypothetical protein